MRYRWVMLDTPGSQVGESDPFDTQDAAEAWMGEEWKRLLDGGALAATLLDGDEELYTMKLTEE